MVKVQLDINSEDLNLSVSRFEKIKETVLNETTSDLLRELKINSPHDHGRLKNSWSPNKNSDDSIIITSSAEYADWLDKGTGLYGPFKQKIYPKKGKYLSFEYEGKKIAVPWVRGIKPKKFVERSINHTKSRLDNILIKSCMKVDSQN